MPSCSVLVFHPSFDGSFSLSHCIQSYNSITFLDAALYALALAVMHMHFPCLHKIMLGNKAKICLTEPEMILV